MKDTLSYENYELVFEDDFEAGELDRSRWNVELHESGWVNEELQEYIDSKGTICLEEGKLLIRPSRVADENGNVSYFSGRISTQWKHDFTYGLFEARLKVPKGKGYLPAFWMMTTDEEKYGKWPVCGEIDIMEIMGNNTRTNYGTIHYGLPHEQRQGRVILENGDFSGEYHKFALLWEPEAIRWYVDGTLFYEVQLWPNPEPFCHDMYIILNLAVGGSWVGYPDETTDFEHAAYAVDYVRVYQKR